MGWDGWLLGSALLYSYSALSDRSDLFLTWVPTVRMPLPRLESLSSPSFLAKHFLNDPSALVIQSLQGLCATNPKLGLDVNNKG